MKKSAALLILLFTGLILNAAAQTVTTWIQPRNLTTNQTLLLGQSQVMEVITLLLDSSTSLDITIENQTLTFGRNGINAIPQNLVIAGPATIVMRRSTAGDEGSLMTFRISETKKPERPPQITSR